MDTYSFKFCLLKISIPRVNGILSESVSSRIRGIWMLFGAQALDSALLSLLMEATDLNMDVSENGGTPKSSILIGFSIINHPFWGTTIFGNIHIYIGLISSTVTFPQKHILVRLDRNLPL